MSIFSIPAIFLLMTLLPALLPKGVDLASKHKSLAFKTHGSLVSKSKRLENHESPNSQSTEQEQHGVMAMQQQAVHQLNRQLMEGEEGWGNDDVTRLQCDSTAPSSSREHCWGRNKKRKLLQGGDGGSTAGTRPRFHFDR